MSEKSVTSKFTTLYIDPSVMKRIGYYTQAATGEVSGLGTIVKDDKGRHIVNKVYLLEQEASAADTELNTEAISKLMMDMMQKNEDPGTLKFWWHSHAGMGVFWSGTDDTCAETLSKEFAFSLVVNKAGDRRCRLDLYDPFRITFDGVKVEILPEEDDTLKQECEAEVKEKVKSPVTTYTNWHDHDYDGHYAGGYHGNRRGFHSAASGFQENKEKVHLPDGLVKDIEKLVDAAELNAITGGINDPATWQGVINEILEDVVKTRLDKKSGCNQVLTYADDFDQCKNGKCKISAFCKRWTEYFDKKNEAEYKDIQIV